MTLMGAGETVQEEVLGFRVWGGRVPSLRV